MAPIEAAEILHSYAKCPKRPEAVHVGLLKGAGRVLLWVDERNL